MGRFAKQHYPRIADALEQQAQIDALERIEGLRRARDELREIQGVPRFARPAGLLLPSLLADERHEAHRKELLLLELVFVHARHALLARRFADGDHEAPVDGQLLAQRARLG